MNKATGKVVMGKLARLKHQQAQNQAQAAELLAEEARLYEELAEGETVDMRTQRVRPKRLQPFMPPENVTPEERENIRQLLQDGELRRRVGK